MTETKDESIREELKEEEVNVYEKDCGDAQLHCITDCIIVGTAWLNPNR
ncbi:MAG: hypothetical protein ACLTMS_22760 [Bacteroides faecis]